jgi:hypothetical protein
MWKERASMFIGPAGFGLRTGIQTFARRGSNHKQYPNAGVICIENPDDSAPDPYSMENRSVLVSGKTLILNFRQYPARTKGSASAMRLVLHDPRTFCNCNLLFLLFFALPHNTCIFR